MYASPERRDAGQDEGRDEILKESLTKQVPRCLTTTDVCGILSTKLRAHQKYGVGNSRLYFSLTEAAQYIQGMCQNSAIGQDSLRELGVLDSLVEAFVCFYTAHLENNSNPLNSGIIIKCWTNLCTALWEAVDNPLNKDNQNRVIWKLIEKHDLRIIDFVIISSKSVEIITEQYVVALVEFLKSLLVDNAEVKTLILAREYFIPALAEGLRRRLRHATHEPLMLKSIDTMGWFLSMLVGTESSSSDDENLMGVSGQASLNFEMALADLVRPSLIFMQKCRLSEEPDSVGIIMMFVSLLGRSLNLVQLFISGGGVTMFAEIMASHDKDAVITAVRLALQVLSIQKKRMRSNDFIEGDVRDEIDAVSVSSKPYSICIENSCPMNKMKYQPSPSNNAQTEPKPKTPLQIVPTDQVKGIENARKWVETCIDHGCHSRKASSSSSPIHAPPPSEVETSISHYKSPSVFSFCANPILKKDYCCSCSENCKSNAGGRRALESDEHCSGSPRNRTGIASLHTPLRDTSSCRSTSSYRNGFKFARPMKRDRKSVQCRRNSLGLHDSDESGSEDDEDMKAVKVPRKTVNSNRIRGERNEKDSVTEEDSITDISRIVADLKPCDIMETDDHVVMICNPVSQKNEKNRYSTSRGVKNYKSHASKGGMKQKNNGIVSRFFRWLFG